MKKVMLYVFFAVMVVGALAMSSVITGFSGSFSRLHSNPEATMAKYAEYWDKNEIITAAGPEREYANGQVVGSITIPRMEIYETPLYYGENVINNNWQITTGGYAGNWGMCGDARPMCAGAHNYQIFKTLETLEEGDKVIIENDVDVYVYEVIGTAVYHDNVETWHDVTLGEAEDYSLILVTCYPLNVANTRNRYIVYTKLISGTVFEAAAQAD